MDSLVTPHAPARAGAKESAVVDAADIEAATGLLLKVAFEAQALITNLQHFVVGRSMDIVACGATFPHGLVFEDIGAALGGMTGEAGVVFGEESRASTLDRVTLVGIVTVAATHAALGDGMMIGLFELPPFVQVAFIAVFSGTPGIDNGLALASGRDLGAAGAIVHGRPAFASGFDVQAGGAVTGLATHVQGIGARGHQSGMRGGLEVFGNIVVTLSAGLRSHIFGAGNPRRNHNGAGDVRA